MIAPRLAIKRTTPTKTNHTSQHTAGHRAIGMIPHFADVWWYDTVIVLPEMECTHHPIQIDNFRRVPGWAAPGQDSSLSYTTQI